MKTHPATVLLLALAVTSQLPPRSKAQCPAGCFGCQPTGVTRRVTCTGRGLATFPLFPVDIQQTLEELSLRSNAITIIMTTDLVNFTSLESLDMSSNRLTTIEPGSFDTTVALSEVNLAVNRLTTIPDYLFENTAVASLDLSQNRIQNISAATFTGLQALSTINLQSNVIRRIPDRTFSELGTIESLDLDNNPLLCDCELRWFRQFHTDSPPLILNAGTCNAPAILSGMALDSLAEDQFTCDCIPGCVNGTCDLSTGACDCDDGYIGTDCSIACSAGSYGAGCIQNCTCVPEQESSPCDHVDGTCHCLPGYYGSNCELQCIPPCINGTCNMISGECECNDGFTGSDCSSRNATEMMANPTGSTTTVLIVVTVAVVTTVCSCIAYLLICA